MPAPVFDDYEELESVYANPRHLMYKKMRLVLDAIKGGDSLLDFGCGSGELLTRVSGQFKNLAGVDATDKSIEITRKKLGDRARLYRYNGTMPKVEGRFDWVTCLDVLEHLEDPPAVISALRDLMKPSGKMVVTVPNWYDFITSKVLGLNKYHLHAHFPWGWTGMLERNGFRVVSCRAVSFPLVGSEFLARRVYFLGMCIFILAEKS